MSLTYISQQIVVYSGIIFLVLGIFGNTMNAYIFSSVAAYRQVPSTFYFLVQSIFESIFLIINLLPRVIAFSYGYDLTSVSSLWCKLRQAILTISGSVSITVICLCAIDQYLVTSSNAAFRHMSQMKVSYRILLAVIIFWCLHSIPFYLYFDISPITRTCGSLNAALAIYLPIYFVLMFWVFPMLITSVFGRLTYRNIRQTIALAEQRADRQLIKMTFSELIRTLVCCTPLATFHIYNAITSGTAKDQDRILKEYLAYTIISSIATFQYVPSFFIFLFSSSRFRRRVKGSLYFKQQTNSIAPTI
ncbi:unnamed protein product [Adineta ricciae]|uniref:G-protein coupled receptors family 1 profile domain-containing protein n=1 Tax=Adineta ricciae TaxID=249248 RepID=A0A814Y6V8_ADIRI|nr:unnamed protein product [Adineta ricciae]CAF1495586.1 unnamed protein product [Adineta ricciae]